jgi:cytochrome c553
MKIKMSVLFVVFFGFSACNPKIDSETYAHFHSKGNDVATLAQATLLANVGGAIQKGGPEYAVEFCNLNASGIIDSLNRVNNCAISRVSEKNRNPQNNLKTKNEEILWNTFQNHALKDTVLKAGDNFVYYKRINTALPACLLCHGNTETDINQATRKKLNELYPEDLATGYKLNEFRGLWKVEFKK